MANCAECVHAEACEYDGTQCIDGIADNCSLFKDRSRFVELPCKAGDRVYAAFPKAEAIIEYVIVSIWVEEAGVSVRAVDTAFFTYGFFMAHEFGKKLFFTKKEAEQALKEREGQ